MATVLVTGANRGLGLEFVRHYVAKGWQVIGTARKPDQAEALRKLAAEAKSAVEIHKLEVTSPEQTAALKQALAGRAIDLLIANAGVNVGYHEPVTPQTFDHVMRSNLLGSLLLPEALVENVAASSQRKLAFISSRMGSIALIESGGAILYRASKAALNAAMKTLSVEYRDRRVICLSLHPGWVRTDMGGQGADIAPQQSIADMIRVLDRATLADSGKFFDHSGAELPW